MFCCFLRIFINSQSVIIMILRMFIITNQFNWWFFLFIFNPFTGCIGNSQFVVICTYKLQFAQHLLLILSLTLDIYQIDIHITLNLNIFVCFDRIAQSLLHFIELSCCSTSEGVYSRNILVWEPVLDFLYIVYLW